VIDQLDSENQTLLKQLKDVRDAAVLAAERAGADTTAATAAAEEETTDPPDEQPPVDLGRTMAAESLKSIEFEFARVAKAGLRPHAPVVQTDVEPLARASAAVATEFRSFAAETTVGQVQDSGVQVWPADTRDDGVATKLRQVAFGLRHEPAVVFGDLGAPLQAKLPSSGRPAGARADSESDFV
jgi:hypothetical protein